MIELLSFMRHLQRVTPPSASELITDNPGQNSLAKPIMLGLATFGKKKVRIQILRLEAWVSGTNFHSH